MRGRILLLVLPSLVPAIANGQDAALMYPYKFRSEGPVVRRWYVSEAVPIFTDILKRGVANCFLFQMINVLHMLFLMFLFVSVLLSVFLSFLFTFFIFFPFPFFFPCFLSFPSFWSLNSYSKMWFFIEFCKHHPIQNCSWTVRTECVRVNFSKMWASGGTKIHCSLRSENIILRPTRHSSTYEQNRLCSDK